jgi:hypothetical protein
MLKAMQDWLPRGQVPDFYCSGSGDALSETTTPGAATMKEEAATANNWNPAQNPKKLRGKIPEDLRAMLRDAQEEGNESIVSWLPHGRAFKVHNKHLFVQNILKRYFKATKYTYFSDTVRIWGFARLKDKGRDKGAYFHRYFVKDRPSLTRHLSRQQMKDAMVGWPPPNGEVDLWSPDVEKLVGNVFAAAAAAAATTTNTHEIPTVPTLKMLDEQPLDLAAVVAPVPREKRSREQWESTVI